MSNRRRLEALAALVYEPWLPNAAEYLVVRDCGEDTYSLHLTVAGLGGVPLIGQASYVEMIWQLVEIRLMFCRGAADPPPVL